MSAFDDRALMNVVGDRALPANVELEQALLGALLVNNDGYRLVVDIVKPEHFSEEAHRRIWAIVVGLIEQGAVADRVTVSGHMAEVDLSGLSAPAYIARLCADATVFANVTDYARGVRDLWIRRAMIGMCERLKGVAFDLPIDASAEKLFSEADREMEATRPIARTTGDFLDFRAAAAQAVYRTAAAYRRQGMLVGLSTGLDRLDDALAGLHPGNLLILAGRPGSGKTSLATNIAYAAALQVRRRRQEGERLGLIGFMSLEMPAAELANRILAARAEVATFKLRKGYANELEMERYHTAERELVDLPLFIDETSGLQIGSLKTRARSLKKRHGLELLIIDYLQLLSGTPRRDGNRVQEVTEITTSLKALAKDLDIPIIALSQLSRRVEERDDKRPMLSDLRESGSIEQDADVVMFVFREEYYLTRSEPRAGTQAHVEWTRRMHQVAGVAQLIIGKNRHGPEGVTVTLGFEGAFTRFTNEPEPREDEPAGPERAPRAKKVSLPREAIIALAHLRSLTISHGIENKGDLPRVPRGVRPVNYRMWRDSVASEILDPSHEEKDAVALMKNKVVPALLAAGFICRGGDKERAYAWVTEEGK